MAIKKKTASKISARREPAEPKVRFPSMFIPQSLLDRMNDLSPHRGDLTKLVVEAVAAHVEKLEAERNEKEKSPA
jgi:hypothetical protein